ncbi:MAG TPA: hypothetical protein VK461_10020 [Acidimicrobiales bacterium]|nr:hypothetical protein [Acidimicrobiales bacterium]
MTTSRHRTVALVVVLVFAFGALAGCGGDDSGGAADTSTLSSFDSASTVADALNKAGIECNDFAVDPEGSDASELGLPDPIEVGRCSSQGDDLEIDRYAKPEQVTVSIQRISSTVLCGLAGALGITTISVAYGRNWIVGGMTDDPARYATALGGAPFSTDCPATEGSGATFKVGLPAAPDDSVEIDTPIGKLHVADGFVYAETEAQCDQIKAADERDKAGADGEIAKLIDQPPPDDFTDWGYLC